ncbi:MAG: SRPBCC domain-containing protein [Deltaproteobacteria bacterium]|nr:SRPBCC domain-containing protein [Deltaproteobacteria bacterium]
MGSAQVIERVWATDIQLVWELWTTAEGIASWFGPKGFEVEVTTCDLRVGGAFVYTMRAADPATAAAMEKRGRPASFTVESKFTEVERPHRVVYDSPYGPETMTTAAEFSEVEGGVKLVLTVDATKPEMLGGAMMGWRSSLERLAEAVAAAG